MNYVSLRADGMVLGRCADCATPTQFRDEFSTRAFLTRAVQAGGCLQDLRLMLLRDFQVKDAATLPESQLIDIAVTLILTKRLCAWKPQSGGGYKKSKAAEAKDDGNPESQTNDSARAARSSQDPQSRRGGEPEPQEPPTFSPLVDVTTTADLFRQAAADNTPFVTPINEETTTAKQPKKTWIEIELVGEDDKPIPGIRYEIRLTDNSVQEGTLDAYGRVRFDGIDPGSCEFTFPELDTDAWKKL